jgi:DNA-binding CsgD family transcriptional regulator
MKRNPDIDSLLLKLERGLIFGRIKTPYSKNDHIVTCWREHKCTTKRCPAYGKEHVRCWQLTGTFCNPRKVLLTIKNKFSNCFECPVFLKSTQEKELRALEAFNNIVFMLDGYDSSLMKANRLIMQNNDRIIKEYRLSVREFSILPMVLAGEKRATMARELGISINTLKTHLRHLFGKIKVRSVSDLRDKLELFTTD